MAPTPRLCLSYSSLNKLAIAPWRHPHNLHNQPLLATGALSSTLEVRSQEVKQPAFCPAAVKGPQGSILRTLTPATASHKKGFLVLNQNFSIIGSHPSCDLLALPLSLGKCQTLSPPPLLSRHPPPPPSLSPSRPSSFWERQQRCGLPGVPDLYSELLVPCIMVPSHKGTRPPPRHPLGPAAGGGAGATSCRALVACQCRWPSLPGGARPGCVLPSVDPASEQH